MANLSRPWEPAACGPLMTRRHLANQVRPHLDTVSSLMYGFRVMHVASWKARRAAARLAGVTSAVR
jgi:hypothetical protein